MAGQGGIFALPRDVENVPTIGASNKAGVPGASMYGKDMTTVGSENIASQQFSGHPQAAQFAAAQDMLSAGSGHPSSKYKPGAMNTLGYPGQLNRPGVMTAAARIRPMRNNLAGGGNTGQK